MTFPKSVLAGLLALVCDDRLAAPVTYYDGPTPAADLRRRCRQNPAQPPSP